MASILGTVILTLGLLSFALVHPAPSLAKTKASIHAVKVERSDGVLSLGFTIENCFTPKMEEAILSGVPTTFRIRVVLEDGKWLFFRSSILNVTLERTIKYERLKREFRVTLPETPQKVHTTASFEEAKALMSRVKNLPVLPLWRLEEGKDYSLRIKAELSKVDLPLFFRYILFFVSLWDFETDWKKIPLSTESAP